MRSAQPPSLSVSHSQGEPGSGLGTETRSRAEESLSGTPDVGAPGFLFPAGSLRVSQLLSDKHVESKHQSSTVHRDNKMGVLRGSENIQCSRSSRIFIFLFHPSLQPTLCTVSADSWVFPLPREFLKPQQSQAALEWGEGML